MHVLRPKQIVTKAMWFMTSLIFERFAPLGIKPLAVFSINLMHYFQHNIFDNN